MKLTVDNGRLVPASAWDQERLLSYRNKSVVNAYVTQEKPRWMERKYWAILDRVVTTCGVAQRTAEDLHDHIKLKLGFVNAKFDDNGKLKVTLKSTKLMDDPEYDGFFKEAMGFLFDLTGVDPMTLKKESADVGEEQSEPTRPAAANDAGSPTNLPSETSQAPLGEALADPTPLGEQSSAASIPVPESAGGAATNSDKAIQQAMVPDAEPDSAGDPASKSAASALNTPETATEQRANVLPQHEVGQAAETRATDQATVQNVGVAAGETAPESSGEEEKAGGVGYGAVSPPAAELSDEDRAWLRDGARMMLGAQPEPSAEAKDVLFRQVKGIIMIMPKNASTEARNRMEQIKQHCMGVCRGEWELDLPMVARAALSTVEAVTPAPVSMGRKAK